MTKDHFRAYFFRAKTIIMSNRSTYRNTRQGIVLFNCSVVLLLIELLFDKATLASSQATTPV